MRLDDLIATIGKEATLAIIERWGGNVEYIPVGQQFRLAERNHRIIADIASGLMPPAGRYQVSPEQAADHQYRKRLAG